MKIGIVNDSTIAQEAIKLGVATSTDFEVAWIASDGNEAIRKCAADTPDIILMDLAMPLVDGVSATKKIMESTPCAILIVTAFVEKNNDKIYEAMGYGAIDAIEAPYFLPDGSVEGTQALVEKITRISTIINEPPPPPSPIQKKRTLTPFPDDPVSIVAIGASTGGPQALLRILSQLPPDFPAPIVIVQHVDTKFAEGLAEWLDIETALKVKIAQSGDSLIKGTVYIASTNDHLCLDSNACLNYTSVPLDMVYRPSIDVFFKSLAKYSKTPGIALLLTGMGQDGAEGMLLLRKKGWFTIAQSQKSCVVFGMPKAAIDQKAVRSILDIEDIPSTLLERLPAPSLITHS